MEAQLTWNERGSCSLTEDGKS